MKLTIERKGNHLVGRRDLPVHQVQSLEAGTAEGNTSRVIVEGDRIVLTLAISQAAGIEIARPIAPMRSPRAATQEGLDHLQGPAIDENQDPGLNPKAAPDEDHLLIVPQGPTIEVIHEDLALGPVQRDTLVKDHRLVQVQNRLLKTKVKDYGSPTLQVMPMFFHPQEAPPVQDLR